MSDKGLQTSAKKTYSDLDVLKLLSDTFSNVEQDAKNGNPYAIKILEKVFSDRAVELRSRRVAFAPD